MIKKNWEKPELMGLGVKCTENDECPYKDAPEDSKYLCPYRCHTCGKCKHSNWKPNRPISWPHSKCNCTTVDPEIPVIS